MSYSGYDIEDALILNKASHYQNLLYDVADNNGKCRLVWIEGTVDVRCYGKMRRLSENIPMERKYTFYSICSLC